MSDSNLTLSIQLIDDNGQPLIDEIFSGGANEVRSSVKSLLRAKEKWNMTDPSPIDAHMVNESRASGINRELEGLSLEKSRTSPGGAAPPKPPNPAKQGSSSADSQSSHPPLFSPDKGIGDNNVFKESGANAGILGGERTPSQVYSNEGVPFDNSLSASRGDLQGKRPTKGPPTLEIITESERNSQILRDGGGSRVNRGSQSRIYELGGYEKSVILDNSRHKFDRSAAIAEAEAKGQADSRFQDPNGVGVPYEVAGVGSRIKNLHRVGGQRVQEMDHFVAAVATPKIEVLMKGEDGSLVTSPEANDIGTHVALFTRDTQLNKSFPVRVDCGPSGVFPVLIDSSYVKSDPSLARRVADITQVFAGLLSTCMHEILGLPCDPKHVQLFYMTTMRADDLCCCISPKHDHKLYINVQYFEQQLYCTDSAPYYVRPDKFGEALQVWCTRVQMAVRERSSPWATATAKKGLYDNGNRERYHKAVDVYR